MADSSESSEEMKKNTIFWAVRCLLRPVEKLVRDHLKPGRERGDVSWDAGLGRGDVG